MVFEPLGVAADDLGAARSLAVAVVHDAFPGCLAAERIVIVLDETVHEVHVALRIAYPGDIVLVPHPEVAGAVIFHQFVDVFLLGLVLGERTGCLEMADDDLDGRSVEAVGLPRLLDDLSAFLDDLAVESVADGVRIGRVFHLRIEVVDLLRRYAVIEIDGGGFYQVFLRSLILQRGIEFGIVDHLQQEIPADGIFAHGVHQRGEIILRACRQDLVVGVVMVDAVAEEHALGIDQEVVPLGRGAVNGLILEDGLEDVADFQVVLEILVPGDVAAGFGRFAEVIDIFFLLQGKVFPARHLVAEHLDVGEFVDGILETGIACLRSAGCQGEAQSGEKDHGSKMSHRV